MIRFREPLTADIRDFLSNNAMTPFSYPDLGCSRGRNVAGFNTDRVRIEVGSTDEAFEKAKRAIRNWRGFATDWVRLCWPYKKIAPGTVVAVQCHQFGFYSVNAARIVYAIDEPNRFGFGFGTLTDHMFRGEMSFLIYREENGKVYYEISSISRPGHWLAWIFYPFARQLQNRFSRDSLHAMLESIRTQEPPRTSVTPAEPRQEIKPEQASAEPSLDPGDSVL